MMSGEKSCNFGFMKSLLEKIGDAGVVMVCGVSGSGKTTLARRLERCGYRMLSIDRMMWDKHGLSGVDYPEELYPLYLEEAETELQKRLDGIIAAGGKAVVDFTFCKRSKRDAYRDFAASRGAGVALVYCDTPLAEIKERLHRRNLTPGPDSAIVTDEMAERFFNGFQAPGQDESFIRFCGDKENN